MVKLRSNHFTVFKNYEGHDILVGLANKNGHRSRASKIVFNAYRLIKHSDANKYGLTFFLSKALDNLIPALTVRRRVKAGSIQSIPAPIRPSNGLSQAVNWLFKSAISRSEKGFSARLAGEFMDAYAKKGKAYAKKTELYRLIRNNRSLLRVPFQPKSR